MKPSRLQTLGITLSLVAGIALTLFLGWPKSGNPPTTSAAPPASGAVDNDLPPARFVGRAACAGCHAEQERLWRGSHHDLAMQEANAQTVLGDFNNAEFSKDGVVSRFFQREGRYWVNTDGPDGQLADFEIL